MKTTPENKLVPPPCDLCGVSAARTLFVKEGFPHLRCLGCGLVFVHPRAPDHLASQRAGGTGSMGEDSPRPAHVRRMGRELKLMEPYRRLNRVMEVGPGRGWFLCEAARAGWETWAVEVNVEAVARLKAFNMHKVIASPAEDLEAPQDSVDVVRLWDVIEHLVSPRRALRNLSAALRPGGLLRVATTNFASLSCRVNGPEWVYLNGADHIALFEPATITKLIEREGFTVRSLSTRSFNLRRKLYHPERDLPPRRKWLRPFRKLIDTFVGFTSYGHQMIVTAEKRRVAVSRTGHATTSAK